MNNDPTEPTLPSVVAAAISATQVCYGRIKEDIKRATRQIPAVSNIAIQHVLNQLIHEGYVVIQDYYSAEICATLRGEIDRIIFEQPEALQRDKIGADCRIFGSERASGTIRAFHEDAFCREIGEAYRRGPLVNFSTLAARLIATAGNLGSGQGWHRDAFHFQYKAMIYLSDVGEDNGPFQLLPRSHHASTVVRDTFYGRLQAPPSSRITEAQIRRLLTNPDRAKALPAKAGTLILFDSSTVHRGMPIQAGRRYALTNYYFAPESVTPALEKAFAPFAAG